MYGCYPFRGESSASSITSASLITPASMVIITRVLTVCQPCLPAAPGLMCSSPNSRSGTILSMCECPSTKRCGAEIAANVSEHHFHAIGSEDFHRFESAAQVGAIDIAIHGAHHWRNLLESVDNRFVANVASMPNFVAVLEILGITVIPIGMSVG